MTFAFSYVNQWQYVIDSYEELERLLSILNSFTDTGNEINIYQI